MLRRASADNKLDDYTDAKDIGEAYVEAVGVMTGLEIVDGMTETTIDPTATYTREQAAKIIAYMVLGKTAADSLTCTVAPFDDVAADRWSAGYISFCVEQGIIDGMTDTTFEPTGTLTGFQWAKMLLSAVGFNAKGEFTGDSWSLNTARVAHSVGLFTGDAAGADHVALQRQQAMLYAFNTLTKVGCVVYSEALGDYIYNYNDFFWDRYTYEGTLGWNVFGLRNVEGIIVNNEGVSANRTIVAGDYNGTNVLASVSADTDVYDIWHAVRIWYVDADNNLTTNVGTSVYVNDLSVVTDYDCSAIATGEAAYNKLAADQRRGNNGTLGETTETPYEYDLIDNTALDYGYAEVTFYVEMGTIGRTDSTNGKTTLTLDTVRGTVDTEDIMTDISEMNIGDDVIVLHAGDKYYVYPVSATSGNVEDYKASNGAITLTDGTVLYPSNLFEEYGNDNELQEMIDALDGTPHVYPAYSFVLDTHGHYITLNNDGFKTVSYFTGTYRYTSDWGTWHGEELVEAQFVNIETGEPFTAPVTLSWAESHVGSNEYYDVTSGLYGDTTYVPDNVYSSMNPYGNSYAVLKGTDGNWRNLAINSTNNNIMGVNKVGSIRFSLSNVEFIIATGSGSSINTETYTGVNELLSSYSEALGVPVTQLNLTRAIAIVEQGENGNWYATTIFAFDDAEQAIGGYAFFPTAVDDGPEGGWSVRDNFYYYEFAYLNGAENDTRIKVDEASALNVEAPGFYSYTIDIETGYFTLTRVQNIVVDSVSTQVESDGSEYYVANGDQGRYSFTDDTVVVDLTTGDDPITSIDELMERAADGESVAFVFVGGADEGSLVTVPYIYVVTQELAEDVVA